MEVFQTIWTMLTTPNVWLINILSIPLVFIETTVTMLVFITILDIRTTRKQKIIYIFLLSIWTIISNLFIKNNILNIINILIFPMCAMFIFKLSFFKSIIAEIIPLIIMAILDPIFINLISYIFNITYDNIATIPVYRILFVSCIYLSFLSVYFIVKHSNFNITLLDNMDKKTKNILIINSVFGIIAIFLQRYLSNYYSENLPLLVTSLSTISLFTYFCISIYSLIRTTKLELTEKDLEQAQLYNKSLKILHDNVRGFKHDFSNIVQAIGGYIDTNDMNGLKTYYSQLLDDCQKVNNLYTLSPDVINNPAIYSILTSKYHKADELGIKINLEVFLNLNELNMKIYEFTRILGILMDNAIEASQECKEKIINVELRKDFKANRQLLIIENTYKEKNVDIDKIFEKGFSSKPNNTGLGLWEIRQILKKNKNLNLYTSKDSKYFKQQLEIYN